jgi:hypothetical protein
MQRIRNDFWKDAGLFYDVEQNSQRRFVFSLLISHSPYPGHESDHSPPSGARVKKEWSYNTTPSIFHHGAVKENLTCTYFRPVLPIYGLT